MGGNISESSLQFDAALQGNDRAAEAVASTNARKILLLLGILISS